MSIAANTMQTMTTTETTQQQQSSSWEDMEYGTPLDLPEGLVFKNTFIACPKMRSASLDEFVEPRGWKSCPNSAIEQPEAKSGLSEIPEAVDSSASTTSGDLEEHEAETSSTSNPSENDDNDRSIGELPEGMLVKNTFIDYPAVRSTSLDEYYQEKGWVSCPVSRMQSEVENQASEIQQAVIAEACESLGNSSDAGDEKEEDVPTLRLLELLPRPEPVFSLGSIPHSLGQPCKPCGFVHKAEGCSNAANCQYCHLCPPGTIKQRKKVKKVMVRQVRHQMHQMHQGWHY
jgi:hypothetical protein